MLNHIELLFKPHLRSQNIIERIILRLFLFTLEFH